ncbi:neuronal cell adhesion molecule-like [Anneissia japonica]|uniref:neuronal cell adhesion molecule-like n=1 Tax=Anneissia japonica TaxID=1529436 RepID=UPI001425A7E4|nr:neuronal cell adhesion molecule-like [Anneissia japonica]
MAGEFCLATFIISLMLCITLAADSSPPKITYLWHGGMSDSYGNQPLGKYPIDPRQPAVFNCDAEGIPEPIFVWTRNGSIINSDDRISFAGSGRNMSINNPTRDDNGLYQCNATSSRGTALSQEIDAILAYMDPFTDKVSSFTRRPNEKVILNCNPPKSFPKVKISWAMTKDLNNKYKLIDYTVRVSQSTTGDLIIGDVVEEDAGFYVCQVNNMILSKIQDSPAKRIVVSGEPTGPRQPQWVSFPDPQNEALVGSDTSLKCIADGYETPDIEWEDYPENDDRFSIASFGQELVITNVKLSDSKDYTCVAVSGDYEIIKSFELIVQAAPSWIKEPNDVAIAPGETATITCEATGVPPPDISWLVNGAAPATVDRRVISGNTVTITGATTEDNSVYQCVAENKHGKIMADAILSVNVVEAEITTPPEKNKEAAEGESVTLNCGYVGSPAPVVTWEGKSGQISNNDKYTVNADGSLTIKNVAKTDEGDYTCKVVNKGGESEATGSIVFRTKTTIVQGVVDTTVKKPVQATLTCTATYDEKAEIVWSWTANGKPTGEVTHGRFRYNSDRNTIDILKTKVSDTGEYCCTASTTFDSAKSCGNLTVQDVPTAPYDVKVVDRGDASVAKRISWQPSNPKNSPIIEYIIEFNTTTYAGFPWKEFKRTSETSDYLELAGGLTYYFRVIALNGVGQSNPSQASNSIQTPAGSPTVNPSNVVGQSDNPNTMVISWDPMDVTQYGGEGFAYKIEYKNTSSSVWMDKIVPEGQSSTTVTDTKIYQEFQIKVTAINDIGDGPEPQVIIGYSGEGTPQAAPGNVNVNVTSPNSALVTFDPVPAESLQGKLKYYRVYYTESAAQVSGSLESVECGTPSCEVSNLKPSTDYELYVVVANGKKEGPPSETQRFSTPEAPPGQPLNFEIVMLSKKMKLFWAPATRGGEVDSYQVKYSPKINEVPIVHIVKFLYLLYSKEWDKLFKVLPNKKKWIQYSRIWGTRSNRGSNKKIWNGGDHTNGGDHSGCGSDCSSGGDYNGGSVSFCVVLNS